MYKKYVQALNGESVTSKSPSKKGKNKAKGKGAGSKFVKENKIPGGDAWDLLANTIEVYGSFKRKRKWEYDTDEEEDPKPPAPGQGDKGKEDAGKPDKEKEKEKPKPKPKPSIPKPPPPPPLDPIKPKPKPKPVVPKVDLAQKLHVKDIDFHVEENTRNHHTDKYFCTMKREDGMEELVCRRGQPIKVTIEMDRPFDKKDDGMVLIMEAEANASMERGTQGYMMVFEGGRPASFDEDFFFAWLESVHGNKVTVTIHIPPCAVVAAWFLSVTTYSTGKNKSNRTVTRQFQYDHGIEINILFNPWCPEDTVYMEDESLLNEYILNDQGCVYRGSNWSPSAKPWLFGQFEENIIDIAYYLLFLGFNREMSEDMSDPIKCTRIIAQIVNNCDDNGVLAGNWSGDYKDGVSPSKWVGSLKILRQYYTTGEPVLYGQCWVFSAVTTTVCRALGIPCRSVTNFSSAHDQDGSCSIDKYMRETPDGGLEPIEGGDSVWNFHVWNEVWFCWPDFDTDDYDGWQVIDATPQEASGGVYTCGPCPVKAVRKGECDIGFDTGFVFAEVNADRLTWKHTDEGPVRIGIDARAVGKKISTKKPDGRPYEGTSRWHGEKCRLDVTDRYKPQEGSVEERLAVIKANQTAIKPLDAYENVLEHHDIRYELKHGDEVEIGQPVEITLIANNSGGSARTIGKASIVVTANSYTGEQVDKVKRLDVKDLEVAPGKAHAMTLTIIEDEYRGKLDDQAMLQIQTTSVVKDGGYGCPMETFFKDHIFRFTLPDLTVVSDKPVRKGELMTFTVSFKNPLKCPLTNCDISSESAGFEDFTDIRLSDVKEKEFKTTVKLKAMKKGTHTIVFSFDSHELKDISGSTTATVE